MTQTLRQYLERILQTQVYNCPPQPYREDDPIELVREAFVVPIKGDVGLSRINGATIDYYVHQKKYNPLNRQQDIVFEDPISHEADKIHMEKQGANLMIRITAAHL